MQSCEIGLFQVNIFGREFKLTPSFRNMAKIADSKKILRIYEMIHSPKIPEWLRLEHARDILLACSDSKDIDAHLIKCRNMKPHLSNKKISINDQIVVAASLMRHGIVGVNCPEYEGSKESKGKALDKFDTNQLTANAEMWLGINYNDAMSLTMTRFRYLIAAKHPVDSGKKESTPSLDAHKEVMKRLMEKKDNGK